MLADISNVDAIYIVCGRTDMRKSIDGLCAIIRSSSLWKSTIRSIYSVDANATGLKLS